MEQLLSPPGGLSVVQAAGIGSLDAMFYTVAPGIGAGAGATADYVCDGVNDEVEIQAALDAAANVTAHSGGNPVAAQGKPVVLLMPGLYKIKAPIKLRSGVALKGSSFVSSEIRADTGFAGAGMVILNSVATQLWELKDLVLNGNGIGTTINGVELDSTGYSSSNVQFADQAGRISNVMIESVSQDGIHIKVTRAIHLDKIRIVNVGRDGVNMEGPDGFANAIDVGGSGRYGFNWSGTNWRVVNCKSWFSVDNGWEITGTRNSFVGCEAQDNRKHGFHVGAGDNNLVGCIADSNSYAPSDANVGLYDGFYVDAGGRVSIVGFSGKENSYTRTIAQRYGLNIAGTTTTGEFVGSTKDNQSRGVNINGNVPRAGLHVQTDGQSNIHLAGLTSALALGPTGALAQTLDRSIAAPTAQTVLVSGQLYLVAIFLPENLTVTNIAFVTGSTAVGTPTHWWFALYAADLTLLSQTADNTTTAWGANVAKIKALPSPVKITGGGLFYLGIMVAASVMPTILGTGPNANSQGALTETLPIISGQSTGSLGATAPAPAGALTAAGSRLWGWVS